MFRFMMAISVAGSAVVALIGFVAPAAASPPPPPPWRVTANAAPTGTVVFFKAATVGSSPQLVVTDLGTGQSVRCASSRVGGATTTGVFPPAGLNLLHVIGPTFTAASCVNPSSGMTFTPNATANWPFNGNTYVAGVTTGRLANIDILWSSSSGCSFKVTGNVLARYYNGAQNLQTFPASTFLRVVNPSAACGALFVNNDPATLVATYHLAPGPHTPINIT